MRARSLTLSALAGLSLLSLAAVSSVTPAYAHNQASDNISKLDKEMDVRAVLRDLFRQSGKSFDVDPRVQGPVTLSLRNVSLDAALTNILTQVNATYRVEDGVYQVVPQGQAPGQGGIGGGGFGNQGAAGPATRLGGFGGAQGGLGAVQAAEPPLMTIDGNSIFVLRRGVLYKVNKSDMSLLGQVALGPTGPGGFGGGRGAGGGLGGGRP